MGLKEVYQGLMHDG